MMKMAVCRDKQSGLNPDIIRAKNVSMHGIVLQPMLIASATLMRWLEYATTAATHMFTTRVNRR